MPQRPRDPHPGAPSAPPLESNRVRERDSRSAGAGGRCRRRSCHRRCERRVRQQRRPARGHTDAARAYLSAAAKISALAVGNADAHRRQLADVHGARRRVADASTSKGCRSGRAAACSRTTRSRWTASYVIKAELLQTNLGAVRGLLETHEIEYSVDGAPGVPRDGRR